MSGRGYTLQPMILRAFAGAFAVFCVIVVLRLAGSLERMELAVFDLGLRARPAAAIDTRFVIIDETEDDLQRWGHPMSDETIARILERALALGPRVVGVDKFRDIPVPPGSDALERVLAAHQNIVWIYQFGGHGMRRIAPPAQLAQTARAGFNDVVDDPGGIVRRGLLYLDDGGPPQPSFPLLLALGYLARDAIVPLPDPDHPAQLRLGRARIAPFEGNDGGYAGADAGGYQMLLDYRGMPSRFARVTVTELLEGRADPSLFGDRVVIFGASAESLKDYFYTPYSSGESAAQRITGADLHGHLASQLIRLARGESVPVRTFPEWIEYALLALACAAGLVGWLATRAYAIAASLAAGAVLAALAWYAFAMNDTWFPVVPLAAGFFLSTSVSAGARAAHEAHERAALMSLFARHVSKEVARELWSRRQELLEGYALRPRALEATVLFADIRGYSPVAERLEAADTARWLNQFMGAMAETVMQHRGIVRQYAGDEVMAVFGAPAPSETDEARERDARNAVECAMAMCRRLAGLNDDWRRKGQPVAGMRIGIHSGPMVSCSVGSAQRLEYAVVGDSVNVAARLQALQIPAEGVPPEDACRILVSEKTQQRLRGAAACERVGSFEIKGRRGPVTVYRVPV
jgi:adenylate cyclase